MVYLLIPSIEPSVSLNFESVIIYSSKKLLVCDL